MATFQYEDYHFPISMIIRMMLKVYSLTIRIVHFGWVVTTAIPEVAQATFEFFIPPPLKPVSNETALFRYEDYHFPISMIIRMMLKVYSLTILIVDFGWVVTTAITEVAQATFEFFIPPPLKPVSNETALIIGTAAGVGRELALQLAELGATVVCVDINEQQNLRTTDCINYQGGVAYPYTLDITKRENVRKLAEELKDTEITMIFYACGMPNPWIVLARAPQDPHTTLDRTLTGYIHVLNEFVPAMQEKNHGHIVALVSLAGISYNWNLMLHGAAQFSVRGLAELLRMEFRIRNADGIHVSLIHIYPFILHGNSVLRKNIGSYFGAITPEQAAKSVLQTVRRNYPEASVPKYVMHVGNILRLFPIRVVLLIRELLDTTVDFG